MTLIKSISGIRGTIGGKPGDNLTPQDIVLYSSAYATWLKEYHQGSDVKVVVGRDARISGELLSNLVSGTLCALGNDVIDLGLSTTPTVELAVPMEKAQGGIILTASHNPFEWNALKLLNEKGEFVSSEDGKRIVELAERGDFNYNSADALGTIVKNENYLKNHIDSVLALSLVNKEAISKRPLKVVVDAVNSTGGIFIPALLRALGVNEVIELYCDPNGKFPHNPEPLKENLKDLSAKVIEHRADLGIAVDPDVDRLVFVCEDGELFGEEYTLVSVADYILGKVKGNTVSNLSSTRALRDVTEKHGGNYFAAAVGEVNVVEQMKEVNAVIGGEGNGGVIYPDSHYGRDALVGVALFLSHLCTWKEGRESVSALRQSYPSYFMSKNKITLSEGMDVQLILDKVAEEYKNEEVNTIDGVKIDFESEWVHLRKSNTEPIIRIYTESDSQQKAEDLAALIIEKIKKLI